MKKESENKVQYGTVSLPLPLIDKVKVKIKGTGMASVSAYVNFVLRQVLSSDSGDLLNDEDTKKIKKRLKSLGYH